MTVTATKIQFGDNLAVTDLGAGAIRVDGTGGGGGGAGGAVGWEDVGSDSAGLSGIFFDVNNVGDSLDIVATGTGGTVGGDGINLHASTGGVEISAYAGVNVTGSGIVLDGGTGGVVLSAYQINLVVQPGGGGSLFVQVPEAYLIVGAGGFSINDPGTGDGSHPVFQVKKVGAVYEYHIKAGATWIADLP